VLEKKAETVFGPTPSMEKSTPALEGGSILSYETAPILSKPVIGKDDIDIAAMIKKLGNSDWVREGRKFYDENEGVCPFCQRTTNDAFAQSLSEYFDETFENDIKSIDLLLTNYKTDSARLQQQTATILADPCKFLETDKLKVERNCSIL